MQTVRLLRLGIQAVAFAIISYQMILAVDKYAAFTSIPVEHVEDIAHAKLPDIYICLSGNDENITGKAHSVNPLFF